MELWRGLINGEISRGHCFAWFSEGANESTHFFSAMSMSFFSVLIDSLVGGLWQEHGGRGHNNNSHSEYHDEGKGEMISALTG